MGAEASALGWVRSGNRAFSKTRALERDLELIANVTKTANLDRESGTLAAGIKQAAGCYSIGSWKVSWVPNGPTR